jgi:hypothetical protein
MLGKTRAKESAREDISNPASDRHGYTGSASGTISDEEWLRAYDRQMAIEAANWAATQNRLLSLRTRV